MSSDWRQQALSKYTRQYQHYPEARRLTIGPDDVEKWYPVDDEAYDVEHVLIRYSYPWGAARNSVIGANGKPITYTQPRLPASELNVQVLDWDMPLQDRFERWRMQDTDLRLWVWGSFVAVGFITKIVDNRPFERELNISFRMLGARKYLATASAASATQLDGVSSGSLLNVPFRMTAPDSTAWGANTVLHGQEILG